MKITGLPALSGLGLALWATVSSFPAVSAGASAKSSGIEALEEVVVTAQRREENISRVPISISAFSHTDLNTRDIKSVGEIGRAHV